ncbi:tRNA (adenosine(37)-N6)-threonylcarbamoyltransferase complex ATPase subunit type 1 TsaE [Patescibacteria group bacterium]|nr:tRNA (adenosine(37)-N6)-threonylcarbamoyltransferase complex ATPase subunit type 1 TsaE [Patescibacteria group bacterium]
MKKSIQTLKHKTQNMKRPTRHKSFQSVSVQQTKKRAAELGRRILQGPLGNHALVIALRGNLGSGKTTFVQGLAREFGIKEKVLSPTFLIIKRFHVSRSRFREFYHIDCYRLKSAKELLGLEWKEIIQNPNNIVAVEWADHVKSIIPKHALWISFSHGGREKRTIRFGL